MLVQKFPGRQNLRRVNGWAKMDPLFEALDQVFGVPSVLFGSHGLLHFTAGPVRDNCAFGGTRMPEPGGGAACCLDFGKHRALECLQQRRKTE